jgi:alkylation response protein AidB-like acyl-CoA dehydrogenase
MTQDWVGRAREIVPHVADAADEIERRRELPSHLLDLLIERGFFRLLQPRALGGAELDPARFAQVTEAIAQADASTAWCICQASGCSMVSAYLAPDIAREIFGPPQGILAWGPPSPIAARAVDGGYVVSGAWSFASGSRHASWLGAHVRIIEANGMQKRKPDGRPVLRTLLFPKSSAKMIDIWHVIGLRGTASNRYEVQELFVPGRFATARDDPEIRREAGTLYRFTSGQLYSIGFAGVAIGIARAVIGEFVALARDRVPRGAVRTMRENNVVQSQLAQAEARLRSARAFLQGSVDDIWRDVQDSGALTREQGATIRLASTWAIQQAREVVNTLYHAAGSAVVFEAQPFERRFRDINTVSQQAQGRQIHFESVGQFLLGLEPENEVYF